jgi:hypothetical protein
MVLMISLACELLILQRQRKGLMVTGEKSKWAAIGQMVVTK